MKQLLLSLFCLPYIALFGQTYSKGLIFDDDAYEKLEMKAPLTRGSYGAVPSSASLKIYCPTPGNQNPHGTCVGWATSYAARTILWAKQNQKTDKTLITQNAFSPDFVYKSIEPSDNACSEGSQVPTALRFIKTKGDIFKKDFPQACPSSVPTSLFATANNYKIDAFATLFNFNDAAQIKIEATKKSLAEGNPVTIGMLLPRSFQETSGELWSPVENIYQSIGGHAMCVIGYDDNKYGGAFEILNSWGTAWANGGFVWVKYSDYAYWTKYGFELINNIQPPKPTPPVVVNPPKPQPNVPTPQPTPTTKDYDFSGDLRFVLANGTPMNTSIEEIRGLFVPDNDGPSPTPKPAVSPNNFKPDPNWATGKFIAYRMDRAYTEGTQFRLYLRNNEPAYVYALAMDNTNQAVVLFPHKPTISPALNYKNNEVALPSESQYIQMDNVRGTDVFCLLHSKQPLDIQAISHRLEQETGTFFQRLYKTMGTQLVDRQYLRYYNQRIRFEVKSQGTGFVVPIVVEIPHN